MWSIMASFMLYVVDKYAWDFYIEHAKLELTSSIYIYSIHNKGYIII